MMKTRILLAITFLVGCSPNWHEYPYEVYWINGNKTLGYSLGNGSYMARVDSPQQISTNENYIAVYACPENLCSYYYIDKQLDHKFAGHDEFVFGPFSLEQYEQLSIEIQLPDVSKFKI